MQTYPDITLDDAYEIQQLQLNNRLESGLTVSGYKVGLTSAAMQRQFGVDQPDYGFLTSDILHPGLATSGHWASRPAQDRA